MSCAAVMKTLAAVSERMATCVEIIARSACARQADAEAAEQALLHEVGAARDEYALVGVGERAGEHRGGDLPQHHGPVDLCVTRQRELAHEEVVEQPEAEARM